MAKVLLRDGHHRETVAEAIESYLDIVTAVGIESENMDAVLKEHATPKARDIRVLRDVVVELRA